MEGGQPQPAVWDVPQVCCTGRNVGARINDRRPSSSSSPRVCEFLSWGRVRGGSAFATIPQLDRRPFGLARGARFSRAEGMARLSAAIVSVGVGLQIGICGGVKPVPPQSLAGSVTRVGTLQGHKALFVWR